MTTEGKAADNTGLAKVAVQCFADTFVVKPIHSQPKLVR